MTASTVLVTGASSGIGRACVALLDRTGWRVFAGIRSDADAASILEATSGRATPVTLDVTDADEVAAAALLLRDAVGPAGLDAVVNNAGVALGGMVETTDLGVWRRVFEVNLIGQLAVTRATLPMVRTARGRLVFVGSANGRVSGPLLGPYAASKHALEAACESLRHELRSSGVRVVCVEPGAVRTAIWPKVLDQLADVDARLDPDDRARYGSMVAAIGKLAHDAEGHGITAERVAMVVTAALTARRPPARRLIGADAWAIGVAARVLPDGLRDRLVRAQLGLGWR